MNKITIVGSIKTLPQMKKAESGDVYIQCMISCTNKVTNVNGETRDKTDVFNCVAWNDIAKKMTKVAYSNMKLAVYGTATTTNYRQNGAWVSVWQVKIEDFEVLDKLKYRQINNVKDIDELAESDDIF